jgi:hypothetical protein
VSAAAGGDAGLHLRLTRASLAAGMLSLAETARLRRRVGDTEAHVRRLSGQVDQQDGELRAVRSQLVAQSRHAALVEDALREQHAALAALAVDMHRCEQRVRVLAAERADAERVAAAAQRRALRACRVVAACAAVGVVRSAPAVAVVDAVAAAVKTVVTVVVMRVAPLPASRRKTLLDAMRVLLFLGAAALAYTVVMRALVRRGVDALLARLLLALAPPVPTPSASPASSPNARKESELESVAPLSSPLAGALQSLQALSAVSRESAMCNSRQVVLAETPRRMLCFAPSDGKCIDK